MHVNVWLELSHTPFPQSTFLQIRSTFRQQPSFSSCTKRSQQDSNVCSMKKRPTCNCLRTKTTPPRDKPTSSPSTHSNVRLRFAKTGNLSYCPNVVLWFQLWHITCQWSVDWWLNSKVKLIWTTLIATPQTLSLISVMKSRRASTLVCLLNGTFSCNRL